MLDFSFGFFLPQEVFNYRIKMECLNKLDKVIQIYPIDDVDLWRENNNSLQTIDFKMETAIKSIKVSLELGGDISTGYIKEISIHQIYQQPEGLNL